MSITYTEQTITILADANGDTADVPAMVANNGLAYHRILCGCGECISYNVSHIKTGRMVAGYFDYESQAQEFIDKVSNLCDWTEDYPDPPNETKQQVMLASMICHLPVYAPESERLDKWTKKFTLTQPSLPAS